VRTRKLALGYVVTKSLGDFGVMKTDSSGDDSATQIMRIPAPLLCYWMGASELLQSVTPD